MEFLENLYEIENFGIYLFVIIGILVVLFLVVLFFGRKDQKARKSIENTVTKNEVPPSKEAEAFKEVSEPHPLEVPVVEESFQSNPVIFEPAQKEEIAPTTNVVLNSTFESSPQIETPAIEKEFDFDALAEAISKELETIDKNTAPEQPIFKEEVPTVKETPKEEPILPTIEENNFQIFEPVKMESNVEQVIEEKKEMPVEKNNEVIKPRPSMPTVFSSVYVNREKEEIKPETIKEPIKIEVPADDVITPVKPTIDLPKMVDLPKRVEEPEIPVVKPVIEEKKDEIIFPSINN